MAQDDRKGMLWFDEWVWLDSNVAGQANQWFLPPEKWLYLANTVQAQFIFDYWAVGPSAGVADKVQIGIQQCPRRTLQSGAWDYMVYPSQVSLLQTSDSIGRIVGQDGSPFDNYPRGWGRVMIQNSDTTAANWAAVRIRCHVRLEAA